MDNKVLLFADSSVDLTKELCERYSVNIVPIHVILNDKTYNDGEISTEEIYENYYKTKTLPKTAAINIDDVVTALKPYVDEGYEIVYVSLGSGLSSSFRNSCLAAEELDGKVYPIDSCSLSTGGGLLVIEAAERIAKGMSAKQVAEEVQALSNNTHASFVIDTLEFLKAGGRCSALAAFGANLLGLKPSIKVNTEENGAMGVGKKYRGKFEKVLIDYVDDTLNAYDNIKKDRVFITYSTMDNDLEKKVYDHIKAKGIFKEIFLTPAGGTISSHCGPNTLGILFMTE